MGQGQALMGQVPSAQGGQVLMDPMVGQVLMVQVGQVHTAQVPVPMGQEDLVLNQGVLVSGLALGAAAAQQLLRPAQRHMGVQQLHKQVRSRLLLEARSEALLSTASGSFVSSAILSVRRWHHGVWLLNQSVGVSLHTGYTQGVAGSGW